MYDQLLSIPPGVIVNIGTHINSTGIILKSYYQDYFYQINLGSNFTFNFKSYGNRKKFWESRNYLGLQLLGGKKNNTIDFYLDGLTHQSTFQNAIGYNYIWYFDNAQTSQRSGGWSLSFTNFALYFENDVFGGQAKDRFRTGHLFITYRTSTIKTGVGFYIWTGETSGTKWIHIERPKNKYGYKSLENTLYGRTSAGALYGSIIYNLPYGQNLFSKIGIDSEHLRHAIQNRFIHDLIFLPAKVQRNTPHYPRLDSKGMPVFDKDSVRKSKFYFQIGTNENWSN
ncbi:MAG: hypothetical protein HYR91_07035 [Flavobacteriia bacterium]|nr:hypothetical protein [Flavobacteriia bacterium]